MVHRILFEGNNAIGVQCSAVATDISNRFLARHEVIICAGVFETLKLLMLSGIGPGKRPDIANSNKQRLTTLD